jgi:hypothetical protein
MNCIVKGGYINNINDTQNKKLVCDYFCTVCMSVLVLLFYYYYYYILYTWYMMYTCSSTIILLIIIIITIKKNFCLIRLITAGRKTRVFCRNISIN